MIIFPISNSNSSNSSVDLTSLDLDSALNVNVNNRIALLLGLPRSSRFDSCAEDSNMSPLVNTLKPATTTTTTLFYHRLRPFLHRWATITSDRWVLEVISSGLTIPFASIPPTTPPTPSLLRDPSHGAALREEVLHLLEIGAIERVPDEFRGKGFYSRYFLVPKKSGGWRPILDLRGLNRFIRKQRFKMTTLAKIMPALNKGDWFAVLDLQDAYFHVTIHIAHRRFLRFVVGDDHFQYRVLPFGLISAPRVFSKTLAVVAAHLRRIGVVIFPYLDDCLIKARTQLEAQHMVVATQELFDSLGLIVNIQKSRPLPTQILNFIGARLDSQLERVHLPLEHFQLIQDLIKTVLQAPMLPVRVCLQLLGHMASTTIIVRHSRLHLRCLQHWLSTVYKPMEHSIRKTVVLPVHVKDSLLRWTNHNNMLSGVPFHAPQPSQEITTDASLIGWGAHMGTKTVQGRWSTTEMMLHINLLEL
nr:uncharacterized protein LOC112545658 [Pelodiscus sinensis]|eukprot:XP_025040076.1 uncharacterized protein LOC112545658 [Pelodiscus sinensis]